MQNRDVWSVRVGSWGDVQVRVHMFFLLFATFTIYLSWLEDAHDASLAWVSMLSLGILFLSVLVHELGHFFVSQRLGGEVGPIVLGPLGGLHPSRIGRDPHSDLMAVLAGPLTSLTVSVMALTLIVALGDADGYGLLRPMSPVDLLGGESGASPVSWTSALRLTCWINWLLVVVNLIPAFPFDGGRACLAFLLATRPLLDRVRAVYVVATLAKVVSVALLVAAWLARDQADMQLVPAWLALVLLAIFVFFSSRMEIAQAEGHEMEDELFGYDFSQGYTSLEPQVLPPPKPGWIAQWLEKNRKQQEAKRLATELAEDQQVDGILTRLHAGGMSCLTPAERALLKRVSDRYRSREST